MRTIPAPRVLPEAAPYWAAADEGRLLLKTCDGCGQPHHDPRDVCPHCLSTNTRWQPAAARCCRHGAVPARCWW